MKRLFALLTTSLLAFGCAGDLGAYDEDLGEGTSIGVNEYSAKVMSIAHETIMATRPQATALLVDRLNVVLANASILSVTMQNVEAQILSPLTDREPHNTCPYLAPAAGNKTITCRYLVDRAIEDALVDSTPLQTGIEQDVQAAHEEALGVREMKFVKGWVGQAVMSGIDSGAVHTLLALRKTKVCDQAPTHQQSAFKLGSGQGQALLEQTEKSVLPTIPRTQCNTDVIANTILAAAQQRITDFVDKNPICAGYKASDLAEKVDLSQAEKNRRIGITEGMRQAYEALRVRLVSTWVCIPPDNGGGDGGGAGDPLVVDLDGDGVHFDAQTKIPFDLSATGNVVLMPALRGADALLVVDANHNGSIDHGAELFGNSTRCGTLPCPDGISALAQHDGNKDGVIDAKDAIWTSLALWRDADHDGKSSPAEVSRLADHHIVSIALTGGSAKVSDAAGNASLRKISFRRADATVGSVYDVWFSVGFREVPSDIRATGVASTLRDRYRGML